MKTTFASQTSLYFARTSVIRLFLLATLVFTFSGPLHAQETQPLEKQPEKQEYDPADRDTRTVRERPRDAIDSGTPTDEKANIRGFFLQVGPAAGLEVGGGRQFDLGPGAHVGMGYIFKGPIGLRGSFTYLSMDSDAAPNGNGELFNGSLDLMIFPLYRSRSMFQPYFVVGPGYYCLESDELGISENGFGGNVGLGANIHLTEHFALGIENNFRPVEFFGNNGTSDDDKYFYSFSAFGTLFF